MDKKIPPTLPHLGLAFSLLFLFYAASWYPEASVQVALGWGFFALLLILKRFSFSQEPPGRVLLLAIGAFVTLRYWMFRTFDTLLFISFWDSLGMMLLYLAETYGIVIYLLGLFVALWPLKREKIPDVPDSESLPTVDVFIPTYSESDQIVLTTAVACTQLDYPKDKLRIFILDDGATVEKRNDPDLEKARAAWERYRTLKSIAETLGVVYLTREKNVRAKAGNINEALSYRPLQAEVSPAAGAISWLKENPSFPAGARPARGELILMLDCDHVPARDFLKNTVGYFLQDEKLFLVQTPHFFINPNPVEKNLQTFSNTPGENEMFYGYIQLGLDFWNSSFFCGSAALLRRKYLEEIGGIQEDTITEDAETALALHARGYRSLYLAKPMTCGLSPETFDDFILQRSRWTQGMIQIFSLKNPLFTRGLSWAQRLCYLNSCLFWFFGLARVIFFLSPLLYLFLGLRVYNASATQVLLFALPHIFVSILVTEYLYGQVRHPFFSELYEAVQSIYLVPVIFSVLLNPRSPRFRVTPKGKSLQSDFLSPLAGPFYLLLTLSLAGVPAAFWRWVSYPPESFAILICLFWNIFNLLFVLLCLGVVWELQQRRRHHRISAQGPVRVSIPRLRKTVDGEIQDISMGGLSLRPSVAIEVQDGEKAVIQVVDRYGKQYSFQSTIVRVYRQNGSVAWGCEYEIPDLETFSRIVSFVYGDSGRWAKIWEERRLRKVNAARSLYYLARIALKGTLRNFKGTVPPAWSRSRDYTREFWGKFSPRRLRWRRKGISATVDSFPVRPS